MLAALRKEGGPLAQAMAASDQVEAAQRAVDEAEHELALYLEADLISVVGREVFRRGVETRQRAVDTARTTLTELQRQSQLGEELASGDLLEAWPTLTVQEKRLLLHGLLDRVVVARANGRGKNAPPTEDRVTIVLHGGLPLQPDPTS